MQSDSFCVRPFIGLEITSQGDFAPCCDYNRKYDGYNLQTHTIDDVLASEEIIKLKQSFLKGERPKKCDKCWCNEANGLDSQRLNSNRDFRPVIADIRVEKEENCFPMIPSGAAHNEMILNSDDNHKDTSNEGLALV